MLLMRVMEAEDFISRETCYTNETQSNRTCMSERAERCSYKLSVLILNV
jgi:hypothetical protein